MTDVSDQIGRLQGDLAQRREELARLDLSPKQAAALSRLGAAHVEKMRNRLQAEIVELERYIASMARLVHLVERDDQRRP